jgi:hypothetical protein
VGSVRTRIERGRVRVVSSTVAPPETPVPEDWSDLTPEEREELDAAFAQADENQRKGVGVPLDDVLPRPPALRRTG